MKTKTIKQYILGALFTAILGHSAFAQKKEAEIRKLEYTSYKAYLNKDYSKALDCLFQLDNDISYKSHKYDYWIGICLLSTNKKLAAIPYLENAERSKQTSFVVNYYLGRAYFQAERYEEARKYFTVYANKLKGSRKQFREETIESDAHSIHVEKTYKDVTRFISECDLKINNEVVSVAE